MDRKTVKGMNNGSLETETGGETDLMRARATILGSPRTIVSIPIPTSLSSKATVTQKEILSLLAQIVKVYQFSNNCGGSGS